MISGSGPQVPEPREPVKGPIRRSATHLVQDLPRDVESVVRAEPIDEAPSQVFVDQYVTE